jgi:hypothetical protein
VPTHPYSQTDLLALEYPRYMHRGGDPGEPGPELLVKDATEAEQKQKEHWWIDANEAILAKDDKVKELIEGRRPEEPAPAAKKK